MITRYGKAAAELLSHKSKFFEENQVNLDKLLAMGKLYAQQPERLNCKNCKSSIGDADFVKHGVGYAVCSNCGHLNGKHQDTDSFCQAIYTADDGTEYSQNYSAVDREAYFSRVRDIYIPKAEFLSASLSELGETPEHLSYTDLGAGSGYFVAAMIEHGLKGIMGYEVSISQVNLANDMIGASHLSTHELDATVTIAKEAKTDVFSMIGVLEHVQNPRDVLTAIKSNTQAKYLYISVPLFSPCIFLEMAFPEVMPRQLAGGHTHLYTAQSLKWMAKEFDLEQVAAWWFGTDMMDLLRSVAVKIEGDAEKKDMRSAWMDMMIPALDDLQLALDQKNMSSEVHMLFRKK